MDNKLQCQCAIKKSHEQLDYLPDDNEDDNDQREIQQPVTHATVVFHLAFGEHSIRQKVEIYKYREGYHHRCYKSDDGGIVRQKNYPTARSGLG